MRKILPQLTRTELQHLYIDRNLSSPQIAELFGCSQGTIHKRLVEYGIPRRTLKEPFPKQILQRLYLSHKLSSRKIAKMYGRSYSYIDRYIREYGFSVKSLADAHIRTFRAKFSGNMEEKAYLIGFRIGDLRARKMYHNSTTILVDCGSTHKSQIELIEKLFKSYGRVWISEKSSHGKVQIECSLNSSFSFLLPKRSCFPSWSMRVDNLSLSIFAGFIDAEGCFYVSRDLKRCKFELGNYQLSLLKEMQDWLIRHSIDARIYAGYKKGYKDKDGYIRNGDYWSLTVHRKLELRKFTMMIYPYLRHSEKRRDARHLLLSL